LLHITPDERMVLNLLAQGTPYPEIALRIGASVSDVGACLNALFAKMGASCTTEAIADGVRRGLVVTDAAGRH
jgi:DNA-binding NarL/FixJ family response regulator